jgi:hypothetical protein
MADTGMNKKVQIELTGDEALVLFELLSRYWTLTSPAVCLHASGALVSILIARPEGR